MKTKPEQTLTINLGDIVSSGFDGEFDKRFKREADKLDVDVSWKYDNHNCIIVACEAGCWQLVIDALFAAGLQR